MNLLNSTVRVWAITFLATLVGCGGGGSSSEPAASTFPSSGVYGWVLKASGATSALKYGLSFVHPSRTDTEYVIEAASSVVSDARVVVRGTVDAAQQRTTGNQPDSLVYIVGGDVRSVPMTANGSDPKSRLQRAQSTSACEFVLEANDLATPANSRYIVSTAGADGNCGSSDDGRAEVTLAASGALGYTPITGDAPLDVARDPATMAPRGWVYPRAVVLWTTPATTIATRTAPAPALSRVLASSPDTALVADGVKLALQRFAAATVTESALDSAVTAGSDWQLIGFDANHFYAYSNPGATFTSSWKIVKVTRATPGAVVLTSGTGLVAVASAGRDLMYLTVLRQTGNELVRIAKSDGTSSTAALAATTLRTVLTSAGTVHQRWTVTGVGSATQAYTIDFIDESNDSSLLRVDGGFPLSLAEADSNNFNASESRTKFLVAGSYGARAFGDATLVAYDSQARAATTLGNLPGSTDFGTDTVFATARGGPGSAGVGFAARSSGGTVQQTGAKVFSFDIGVANSLRFTSSVQ